MKSSALVALVCLAPLAAGCAGRTAPFNELDQAPMTIFRLQGQEQQQAAPAIPGLPGLPGLPGIPPEIQQMGQQVLQGVGQLIPGGLPPGLIPGMGQQPQQQQQQRFHNFVILAQLPVTDESLRAKILDLFGQEDSFQTDRQNCFFPGMGVSFQRNNAPPVDLLVSLQCNQAAGDGFRWPYAKNGLTRESAAKLSGIYQQLWGPVPPGA